jgi:hypothetical protein
LQSYDFLLTQNFFTMQKFLFLCLTLCFACFGLNAQHYKVGETYTFQSEGISYQVRYNKEGVASIKKSTTEDKTSKSYIFANLQNFKEFSADEAASVEAKGSNYWVIPFTEGETKAAPSTPTPSVTFNCRCFYGEKGGLCSASWNVVRNVATVTCVPEGGCGICKLSEGKIGENTYTTGVLMIEATKVVFE